MPNTITVTITDAEIVVARAEPHGIQYYKLVDASAIADAIHDIVRGIAPYHLTAVQKRDADYTAKDAANALTAAIHTSFSSK